MSMDVPTPNHRMPTEILEQIFQLVANPFTTFTEPQHEAHAARETLRAVSLVCKRWHQVVPRFLEGCLQLPWSESQLSGYNSFARHPATTVRIDVTLDKDYSAAHLITVLQSITGVKRLHIVSPLSTARRSCTGMPAVLRRACLHREEPAKLDSPRFRANLTCH